MDFNFVFMSEELGPFLKLYFHYDESYTESQLPFVKFIKPYNNESKLTFDKKFDILERKISESFEYRSQGDELVDINGEKRRALVSTYELKYNTIDHLWYICECVLDLGIKIKLDFRNLVDDYIKEGLNR